MRDITPDEIAEAAANAERVTQQHGKSWGLMARNSVREAIAFADLERVTAALADLRVAGPSTDEAVRAATAALEAAGMKAMPLGQKAGGFNVLVIGRIGVIITYGFDRMVLLQDLKAFASTTDLVGLVVVTNLVFGTALSSLDGRPARFVAVEHRPGGASEQRAPQRGKGI